MNVTLTNLNQPAASASLAKGAAPAAANDAASPAAPVASDTAGAAPAQAAALDVGQPIPAQPALGFAQWLGLDQLAAPAADAAPATPDGAVAAAEADAGTAADEQQTADTPLLGAMAMSMPLMPVAQATLAAVVAALPGVPAAKESEPAADTDISLPGASARTGRAEPAAQSTIAAAPALPLTQAAVEAAPASAPKAAPVTLAADTPAANGDASRDQAAPAVERGTANSFGVAAPAPGAAQRTADTVTLSGPPTAWRQTLQEALGERLHLQVGKNAEQAVIRLEPPMLGRVEIAIRHSAGSLEVHISATNGEVLRQLQSVSEGLRNDLAQRQFTDVAVNIAQAPRGASSAPMFAGGEGRGRQQDGRQQEQTPGEALAEANTGNSPFSLNGRG
ncbi:flagellar hook-length control protein FliK [Massilia litorea]|uniref:Flagellar hook-length control protein FliK n=1 Tax=Massilia litorea TaxID=2769491 RepID=A0A7L9U4I5_9BURK|nr:flagellar hook-length control protein FliK [Massilia litorea]QOL49790.1 flagellar hook-length control protein FliK [Massilia litorea]